MTNQAQEVHTHSLPNLRGHEKVTNGTPSHGQECGTTETGDEAERDEDG